MLAVSMGTDLKKLFPDLDLDALLMFLAVYGVVLLLMLVSYVLHSVGLYSIARRRGIPRPWLAWLPIGGNWILGSISDRYQFVRRKRFRNRKKLLACMELAGYVLGGVISFSFSSLVINIQSHQATTMVPVWKVINGVKVLYSYALREVTIPPRQDDILASAQLIVILIFATLLISLIFYIFLHLAYYDVYASCKPKSAAIFLILGILFPVTVPFFVFACRKQDLGLQEQPPAQAPPDPRGTTEVFISEP